MSIFSKKDKSTKKNEDLQVTDEKTDTKIDKTIEQSLEKSSTVNKIKSGVDEVYPWLDQKKVEKPTATDFPKSKYVDEPKWKHSTPTEKINNEPGLKIKSNIGKKVLNKTTDLKWDHKNKIEEPIANDFPNEIHVEGAKWKHHTQKPSKEKTITKATAHGITVKETLEEKPNLISSSLPPVLKTEIKKDFYTKNKPSKAPEVVESNSDALNQLKELATKKENINIVESDSSKKLKELLQRELAKKPITKEPIIKNKIKPTETKLDWLKKEVIEKPEATDFETEQIVTKPKWKPNAQKFEPEATPIFSKEYDWMKHDKIEEPTSTDFATQTKEIISTQKQTIPSTGLFKSSKSSTNIKHPKWIHENSSGNPISNKTITQITSPKWKKNVVPLKRKRASLKTPIDEIFELLESYKQADTGELAEYTKMDIFTIEKIMRMFEDYGIVEVRYPTTLGKKPTIVMKKEVETKIIPSPKGKILETYDLEVDFIPAKVSIVLVEDEARPIYNIEMPSIGKYTRSFLNYLKNEIAESLPIELDEITDPKKAKNLKNKFFKESKKHLSQYFKSNRTDLLDQLSGVVLHEMYGLGDLEVVMGDDMLEELAINSAKTPVTVYHRIHGWLKTNLLPGTEEEIMNYSSQIGRKIGREITTLSPILDAHLLSGDRVNATLFPISAEGNTLTIRRFARRPWTIIDFIGKAHTMNTEMAALLWLAMQYELNVVISGGTASGKTSALNTLLSLVPSYHRIISIEDVREIVLPKYLKWNWIPMVTRSANPEGMGKVTMLDCMVSSLRMRPDRIIVGEIRRKREAEVLMEAIETGHSIYSTIHANSAYQVLRRLAEQPMAIPPMQIELIDLIVVQYRDRKTNRRRTYEISEIEQTSTGKGLQVNTIYKWSPRTDDWEQLNKPSKLLTLLNLHTGLTEEDLEKELSTRKEILDWMRLENINELDMIGLVMKLYYSDAQRVIKLARDKTPKSEIEKMME
jgi:archaeal flagellar protein FlaI